jgi:hypothetical protein
MNARPSMKKFINVTSTALASIATAQIYNRGLILMDTETMSDIYRINYNEGIREFDSLKAVGNAFGTNTAIYEQADAYFKGVRGFANAPSSLLIGKDIRTFNVPATLFGNSQVDLAALTLASPGTINFSFDTNLIIPVAISSDNITAGPVGIALAIQTALRAFTLTPPETELDVKVESIDSQSSVEEFAQQVEDSINNLEDNAKPYGAATCTFDPINNRFTITSGESGNTAIIGYATGAEIANIMKITSLKGASLQQGRTGATIAEQMDYVISKNSNWAMMGYLNPILYVPGGDNLQLLDQLNWFQNPENSFYKNKYQFAFITSDSEDLDPLSVNSLYKWLTSKGFAETRELLLEDNSIFRYTLFNTNVTLIWDRDNEKRMLGGMMCYGASWQFTNTNTFPSWNNALAALVPNSIDDDQYSTLVEHGFNVYTSFSPALVDTTRNMMGTCGVIAETNGDFTDVQYLSQWYVMRTLRAAVEISVATLMVESPNLSFPDPTVSLPDSSSAIAEIEDAITSVVNQFLNGVYITGKIFDLTDAYDMQQLQQIKKIANPGTTEAFIMTSFSNPKYLLQFRKITSTVKISGKIFAILVYCVGSQVRTIDIGTIATN